MNKFLLFLSVSLLGISGQAIALSSEEVKSYLKENPTFLEKYLESNPEMIRSIMMKKNRVEKPLTMDCSDGIKITTNDVDNVRVNSCALGYCNGKTFCKSKSELKNQNAAVEWCRSHGGKLVEFDHLCPRPENDRKSVGGVCSNLTGILKDELLWTDTPEYESSSYYVFINNEGIPYFSAGRRDQKGYAVCENATTNGEKTSNKTEIAKQNPSEYVLGNPNGTFVIKAIYDYQCGWCKKSHVALQKMLHSEKAKNIKIVLMPHPIFGQISELMAKYVLAAANQGKLAEMHHAIFTMDGQRNEASILNIAKGLGLDIEQLKKDAQGTAVENALKKTKQMAYDLRINVVPAFVVNGKMQPGALLEEKAEEILKMQDDFVPEVAPEEAKIKEQKKEIISKPEVKKTKEAVRDETNLTFSSETTKIFESISEDENPLLTMLKLRKAVEAQVTHTAKQIQDNISNVLKEFDFDGYYKNLTNKAVKYTQENYSDKEVKEVKKFMKKKETKNGTLLLVSTCFSAHTDEEERTNCINMISNQFLDGLDEELKK